MAALDGVGRIAYQLAFQVSPIILTSGIAQNLPGASLPIIAITEPLNMAGNLFTDALNGNTNISLDDFFAQYIPAPGTTLINNEVATYPFANQAVAANSIIAQPLAVSMLMMCPVRQALGYYTRLAILTSLQRTLAQHNSQGGMYTIITPSYIYTNCMMTQMVDISSTQTKQWQWQWQMNFTQPITTSAQALQAQNALMSKLTGNTQLNQSPIEWSGLSTVLSSSFNSINAATQSSISSILGSGS